MSGSNGNGSTALLRCPACRTKVVVQRAGGEIVVLQRAVLVKAGHVYAVCQQCKAEVLVRELSYETKAVVVSDSQDQSPSQDLTISVSHGTIST
jgi:DNA-directed RNA polymerase subunit RPC12/RpoP